VTKKIKRIAYSDASPFLFRPLAIDFLVAEECASWREVFINDRWKKVFDWVSKWKRYHGITKR
jgi:hypothetical protein